MSFALRGAPAAAAALRAVATAARRSNSAALLQPALAAPAALRAFSVSAAAWQQQSAPPGGSGGAQQQSASSSGAGQQPPPPPPPGGPTFKPRATSGAALARRRRNIFLTSFVGGTVAFVAWLAYKYKSVEEAIAALRNTVEGVKDAGVTDPTLEELQRALGPPAPEFYINVIIAMEDVVLRREWDRRYGWRYEIRPGAKEMFKALLDAGAMATLWSEASGAVAMDTVGRLSMDFGMSLPITPLHLGPEHCFTGPPPAPGKPPAKEKHIEHFNRDPKSILLIDFDRLSETCNPRNTVIVKPMSAVAAEAAAAEKAGIPPPADTAMASVVQLVQRIRAEAAASGEVDVPGALASLRAEASAQGFASDAAGLAAYLQHEADAVAELDRQRREGGLGGLLRRTADALPALRGKATTAEIAAARPYRDPVYEAGEGSLLTARVHAAQARMDAAMRGGR